MFGKGHKQKTGRRSEKGSSKESKGKGKAAKDTSPNRQKLESKLQKYQDELAQLEVKERREQKAAQTLKTEGYVTYDMRTGTQNMSKAQIQLMASASSSAREQRGYRGELRKEEQTEDIRSRDEIARDQGRGAKRMQAESKNLNHTSRFVAEKYIDVREDKHKTKTRISHVRNKIDEILGLLEEIEIDNEPGGLGDYAA